METFTVKIDRNAGYEMGFAYYEQLLGTEVAFTTYDGEILVGKIAEDKTGFGYKYDYRDGAGEKSIRLVIKFPNGHWAMLPAVLDVIVSRPVHH